jgi:hypothetical protein
MDTEDLSSHNRCDWEAVECVHKGFPDLDIASPFALIVETVNSRNIGALMIASQHEKVLGKFKLVAE